MTEKLKYELANIVDEDGNIIIVDINARPCDVEKIIKRYNMHTELVGDREFMRTWVRRITNGETTPEEFISVVSNYPPYKFKATKEG